MDVEESDQIFWFDLWVSSYCDAAHDHMIVHAAVPRCCTLIKLDVFHSNILVIWIFEQGVIIWLQYNNGLDLYGAFQSAQSALHLTHYSFTPYLQNITWLLRQTGLHNTPGVNPEAPG